MRPLSISNAEGFLVISLDGNWNMTNPAIAAIDVRCGFFVCAIVESRGMRHDPGGFMTAN
jgi:hypothetical protein